AVLVVNGDHLHLHAVADLADALDLIDILVVQLADVAQAVATGKNLDEGAEVLDRGNPTFIDLADADFLGKSFNLGPGGLGAGRGGMRDVDGAIVVDINLGACGFLNSLDRLAAGTDEQADFLGINAQRQEAWRLRADFTARIAQRRDNVLQNLA